MTWIETIPFEAARGRLAKLYARVSGPDGNVDNIMLAHSLRPHSMEGHMTLYKHVLHHSANTTPKWFLELLGVWTSRLNRCAYCVEHHAAGLLRLLVRERGPEGQAFGAALLSTLPGASIDADGTLPGAGPGDAAQVGAAELAAARSALLELLTPAQLAALAYAERLTRDPASLTAADVERLRTAGWDDGGVLELNQVVAYFGYANRTVLGLGVTTAGDLLGLSPGDSGDPGNWNHG